MVYFKVDNNNVRQRRNNVVIFNVESQNVDQRQNKVVNMTIFKKLKIKKIFFSSKIEKRKERKKKIEYSKL